MNFNHLAAARRRPPKCSKSDDGCYLLPVGNIRATQGENVHLTLFCRNCDRREDVFLSREEYLIQQKLIYKEIGNV